MAFSESFQHVPLHQTERNPTGDHQLAMSLFNVIKGAFVDEVDPSGPSNYPGLDAIPHVRPQLGEIPITGLIQKSFPELAATKVVGLIRKFVLELKPIQDIKRIKNSFQN
jgi:hypothetical protein